MINIDEAFPNNQQVIIIDALDSCNELFDIQVREYNQLKETTVSQSALFEREVKRLEELRDNIHYSPSIKSYDGIYLHDLFSHGWEMAIVGKFITRNNAYKFHPDIYDSIIEEYVEKDPPPLYFEKLSQVSIETVISGMANAKYYYWLKEQENSSIKKETKSDQSVIKTDELEKCYYIIGEWIHQDKTVINKLLDPNLDTDEIFIKPFRKELDDNLFKSDRQRKQDILRHYMLKFHEVQDLFIEYFEILSIGKLENYTDSKFKLTNEDGIMRKLKKYESYVVECHILYQIIFDEIEKCCKIHKVDFNESCIDLNFDIRFIDKNTTGIDRITEDNFIQVTPDLIGKLIELENIIGIKEELKTEEITNSILEIEHQKTNNIKYLVDYLVHPEPRKLIDGLKPLFQGTKGKEAATIILALSKLQLINYVEWKRNELFKAIRNEVGSIGTPQGINSYMKSYKDGFDLNGRTIITDSEIERYCNIIEKL